MKPFLKWAGNKYAILDQLKPFLSQGARLVEPFVGSGAVFLNTEYPAYLLGENNRDLLNLYRQLSTEGEAFITYARRFFKPENNQADVYYELRARFNKTRVSRLKAALFLYLNKHTYNGLCRFNSRGHFNAPFGRYRKVYFPEAEMRAFLDKADQVEFIEGDFLETLKKVRSDDVVYCDPPYVPWSKTADFTCYNGQTFGEQQQQALADRAEELAAQGIRVIVSNHDTPYSRELYHAADRIISFDVMRYISCHGDGRRCVRELIAVY